MRQLPGTGTVSAPDEGVVAVEYDRAAVAVASIQRALRTVGYESSVLPEG